MRERFLRELGAAELWLRDEGIPHVLIGSLACWAHAGHGVAPVFGRLEAFSAVQRCPDIDVLVPRAALDAVREYARAARSGPFPVAIDASGAACFIDLRPGSEQSYLTHRRLRFPVPSDLFAPQPAWLAGVEITTIDPRVLLHTFGTIGGIVRRKDGVVQSPHLRGRTCLCNTGPKCRHEHRIKQHPRWKVEQITPGTLRWTVPSGRQYITEPTRYPI